MDKKSDCLVIIPAYNEEETIKELVARAKKYADVCVIDYNSKDATPKILAGIDGIHVITHQKNTHIPGGLLNDGTHRVHLSIVKDESILVYKQEDLLVFDINDSPELRGAWHGRWPGAVRPKLLWTTEHLKSLTKAGESDAGCGLFLG